MEEKVDLICPICGKANMRMIAKDQQLYRWFPHFDEEGNLRHISRSPGEKGYYDATGLQCPECKSKLTVANDLYHKLVKKQKTTKAGVFGVR